MLCCPPLSPQPDVEQAAISDQTQKSKERNDPSKTNNGSFACDHDCLSAELGQICKWLCGICLSLGLIMCLYVCFAPLWSCFSGLRHLFAVQTVVLNDFPPDLYLVASAGQPPGHIHTVNSTLPCLEKADCPLVNLLAHMRLRWAIWRQSKGTKYCCVERHPLTQLHYIFKWTDTLNAASSHMSLLSSFYKSCLWSSQVSNTVNIKWHLQTILLIMWCISERKRIFNPL